MKSFVDLSTSTEGKLRYEDELWKKLPCARKDEYAITMIGAVDGLDRHLLFFARLGIDSNRLIVVDRDKATLEALKKASKRYVRDTPYSSPKFYEGDFIDVLEKLLKRGYKFVLVDFDGTNPISEYHYRLVDLCEEYADQIRVLHIVASARLSGKPCEFNKLLSQGLGMQPVFREKYIPEEERKGKKHQMKKWCEPRARDTLAHYTETILKQEVVDINGYVGRHSMVTLLINCKKTA